MLSVYQKKYSEIQEKITENLDKSLVNLKKHVKTLLNDNSLCQDHQESNAIKLYKNTRQS